MSRQTAIVALAGDAARLALRQLTHRAAKLMGALLGVLVAVVLVFTQLGFKGALYDSGVAVARLLDGQIILAAPDFRTMSFNPPWMSRDLLYEARGVAGVDSAAPLYASTVQVADPSDGSFLTTWLYAFQPDQPVFTLPDMDRAIPMLRLADTAIIDRQSRYELGALARSVSTSNMLDLVLPSPAASTQFVFKMVGTFAIGPTISADGNIITSDLNYYRFLRTPLDRVSLGVVRVTDSVDPALIKARIEQRLGPRARVFLRQAFIDNEIDFYAYRTPIGFIFNIGLAVGIFVGIVFISQVLHGIISDNIREYAALRAIGYNQTFFVMLVVFIAVAIALVTYLPSVFVTMLIYHVAASVTKLPLDMKVYYLVLVMVIVLAMGIAAAMLSTRKLKSADPVDLF